MTDLHRDIDFLLVEIVEHDGSWWALIAPDPPSDIDRDMVHDSWDARSEPPERWAAVGPCRSARHAALQAPAGAAWDAFEVHDPEDMEVDRDSWSDFIEQVIARARPAVADDPSLPDPLEPPPNPAGSPTHAYYRAYAGSAEYVEESGLRRDDQLDVDLDDLRARVADISLFDEDETIDDTVVWRVDLSAARFGCDPAGGFNLQRPLGPQHLTRIETIPGRPGAPGLLGGLVHAVIGRLRSRSGRPPFDQ